MGTHTGQDVFITADLDQPEFVEMLVVECYKAGAARVVVDFDYSSLQKHHISYYKLNTLSLNYKNHRFLNFENHPAGMAPGTGLVTGEAGMPGHPFLK